MNFGLPADLPAPSARILDAGGWFIPLQGATHVIDIMPYETRRGRLAPVPEPGERFTRATWTQIDFLRPDLRLPYPDGFFDFVYCGHTLEDLADPVPLLREFTRVARAGRIVSPSRYVEQTCGVRDRARRQPGHPHHYWIIDVGPEGIEFSRKSVSVESFDCQIPLMTYERLTQNAPGLASLDWLWQGPIRWQFCDDNTARARARATVAALGISRGTWCHDAALRAARRVRDQVLHRRVDDPAAWWQQMLALSRPYSTLPI